MEYSKAKLKINGDKVPCFKPFLIRNMSGKCLPNRTLLQVPFRHIFICLTTFKENRIKRAAYKETRGDQICLCSSEKISVSHSCTQRKPSITEALAYAYLLRTRVTSEVPAVSPTYEYLSMSCPCEPCGFDLTLELYLCPD
jgi:hypothetical protein